MIWLKSPFMDTELIKLLTEVERYIKRSGVAASVFGQSILNDRAIVLRMRRGHPITSRNMSLIRKYIKDNPIAKRSKVN